MTKSLPVLTPRKVLKALKRAGFYVDHTRGGHYYLKHPVRAELRVTLGLHFKDLKREVLSSIIGQAGMTVEEFLKLL